MKVDQNRIGGTVFESMHGTLVSSQTKCYGKISKVRAESKMKTVGNGLNRRRSMSTKKHNRRRNANLKNLVKKGANFTTKRWREHFLTCAAEAVAAPTHISSES